MSIYIRKNGQTTGPFEENTVLNYLKAGNLTSNDMACRHGEESWQPLGSMFGNSPQASPVTVDKINVKKCLRFLLGIPAVFFILFAALTTIRIISGYLSGYLEGIPFSDAVLGMASSIESMVLLGISVGSYLIMAIIYQFKLIYRMWAAINDGESWISPGKAIGLLFIPLIGIVVAVMNFTKYPGEYNKYIERHDLPVPQIASGLFILYGIMIIIPFVGFAALLLFPVVMKRGYEAINNLVEATEDTPAVGVKPVENQFAPQQASPQISSV